MEFVELQIYGDAIRAGARSLEGGPGDYDELLEMAKDARVVLLGEATHGTHEFYSERARISRRLIEERGFTDIAVEADFPDAHRVNRYIRGMSKDKRAEGALGDFQRFPRWMWRNTDVVELVEQLRKHNENIDNTVYRVGFYGLDLYSLSTSTAAVIEYLQKVDPAAAEEARSRYSCFEHFGGNPQLYGQAALLGLTESCESAVLAQLIDLRKSALEYLSKDGALAEDELFYAEQNARLVKSAEAYYRSMFHGDVASWNLRDTHMAETLEALLKHQDRRRPGKPARIIVWAHNSHIGDARATELGAAGELNLGQLARERFGDKAILVGFTTYEGTVTAASEWDGPAETKRVRPAFPDSYERLLHESVIPRFLLVLRGQREVLEVVRRPLLERAIGVIYRPETERSSHYFWAELGGQVDAVVHIDQTHAVTPLDRTSGRATADVDETFPTGL